MASDGGFGAFRPGAGGSARLGAGLGRRLGAAAAPAGARRPIRRRTAARPPVAPAVPPTPIPFDDAVLRAATDLFTKANLPGGKVALVIDPLIDGVSGAQSTATRSMEQRLVELVRQSFPRFEVLPFTAQSLAKNPVMLIGTFTAINNAGIATGPRDAYRVCLTLADLQSRSIVSKGVARAKPEGIDVTPTPYFADIPMWAKDAGHRCLREDLPGHQARRSNRPGLCRAAAGGRADQRRHPGIRRQALPRGAGVLSPGDEAAGRRPAARPQRHLPHQLEARPRRGRHRRVRRSGRLRAGRQAARR